MNAAEKIKKLRQRAYELPVRIYTAGGKFMFYYGNSCHLNLSSMSEVIKALEGAIKQRHRAYS